MREWRVKIALLEDNPSILDYLSRALEMMGHTVHKYPDSASLLEGEKVVWAFHPTTRNLPNLLRNLFLSWRTLRPIGRNLYAFTSLSS